MNKRSLISFAFLFTFWIVVSGVVDLQHIIVGIILAALTTWFWKSFNPRLPSVLSFRELLLFGHCIIMLVVYIIKSNIEVAKILLFSHEEVSPMFMELELGMKTNWGRVFLATCITITPGTVTVDFNPERNTFTVHALTRENAESLYHWSMITEIKNLERMVKRREAHAMDIGRIHDSNSISPTKGNNRTYRN